MKRPSSPVEEPSDEKVIKVAEEAPLKSSFDIKKIYHVTADPEAEPLKIIGIFSSIEKVEEMMGKYYPKYDKDYAAVSEFGSALIVWKILVCGLWIREDNIFKVISIEGAPLEGKRIIQRVGEIKAELLLKFVHSDKYINTEVPFVTMEGQTHYQEEQFKKFNNFGYAVLHLDEVSPTNDNKLPSQEVHLPKCGFSINYLCVIIKENEEDYKIMKVFSTMDAYEKFMSERKDYTPIIKQYPYFGPASKEGYITVLHDPPRLNYDVADVHMIDEDFDPEIYRETGVRAVINHDMSKWMVTLPNGEEILNKFDWFNEEEVEAMRTKYDATTEIFHGIVKIQ